MAVESYLMFPYENLFQEIISHAGDFGDLVDKEMMNGDLVGSVTVPEFNFDEGDLFKAPFSADFNNEDVSSACGVEEETAHRQYADISHGDTTKSCFNPCSPQTMAATQRMNCLCIKSEEAHEFFHLFQSEVVDSEPCILIESPSSNGNFSSVYPPTAVSHDPSPPQLEKASLAPHNKVSLTNGLLSYASDDQTGGDLGMGNSIIGAGSSADSAPTSAAIAAQVSSPASSRMLSNGPMEETGSRMEELLLEEKNASIIQSAQLINSGRLSSSMDDVEFLSKGDAAGDSLSPLPAHMHSASIMLERSLSSHALGQLMSVPRGNDSSLYPQFSPIHGFPSPDAGLKPQLSELQEMNKRPAFTSMRRVYSTGDIQTMNDMQTGYGCGSPLASSEHSSFEEAGYKVGRYSVEERKQRIHRYKKKRSERNFNKKIKYACRKTLADSRPRVRGRFARNDDLGDIPSKANGGHPDEDDEEEVDHVQEEEDGILIGDKPTSILNWINGMNPLKEKHGSLFGF